MFVWCTNVSYIWIDYLTALWNTWYYFVTWGTVHTRVFHTRNVSSANLKYFLDGQLWKSPIKLYWGLSLKPEWIQIPNTILKQFWTHETAFIRSPVYGQQEMPKKPHTLQDANYYVSVSQHEINHSFTHIFLHEKQIIAQQSMKCFI
jgi:hypothetical protein